MTLTLLPKSFGTQTFPATTARFTGLCPTLNVPSQRSAVSQFVPRTVADA